jgi:hypothetical protein
MTTILDRYLGWRQRLHLQCAERRRERLRRLDGLRDTQHVQIQVPVTDGHVDLITRSLPSWRLAIYGTLV